MQQQQGFQTNQVQMNQVMAQQPMAYNPNQGMAQQPMAYNQGMAQQPMAYNPNQGMAQQPMAYNPGMAYQPMVQNQPVQQMPRETGTKFYGKCSLEMQCTKCHEDIKTSIRSHLPSDSCCLVVLMCLLFGPFGLFAYCCVMYQYEHFCPECNKLLGKNKQ